MVFSTISAQKVRNNFDVFYSGESKQKPVKYVIFDSKDQNNERREDKERIYFHIKGESFIFDKQKKRDTCSISILKKIKLENPEKLRDDEYKYFRKKVEEFEKETNQKIPKSLPISRKHLYFKVYVLEKIANDEIIKYEVDWEYSDF